MTCIGDGDHVVLFAAVKFVANARAETERPKCRDVPFNVLSGGRGFEVGNISPNCCLAGVADGAGTTTTRLVRRVLRMVLHRKARPDPTARAGIPQT